MKKQKRDDIVARADDAFGSSNYAEFTVEKTVEGKYKMKRLLMVLFYVVIIGALVGAFVSINAFMVAIVPILGWMLVFFTWPYVSIEYKYTIDGSMFTATEILGGKKEKTIMSCKVRDFELIAPDSEEYQTAKNAFAAEKTYEVVPSMNTYDRYFAIGTTEAGEKIIVYFRATTQALKAFKYYNSEAIVMSEVSR